MTELHVIEYCPAQKRGSGSLRCPWWLLEVVKAGLAGGNFEFSTVAPEKQIPAIWIVRQGSLVAQRFDPSKGQIIGERLILADSVGFFSVSAAGLIAYRGDLSGRQLTWFDRTGTALASPQLDSRQYL